MNSLSKSSIILVELIFLFAITGCKKLVSIDPPATQVAAGSVFSTDATAIAVLTGIYNRLSATNFTSTASLPNISLYAGLSADELSLWSGASISQIAYYKNALTQNVAGYEFWNNTYPLIYSCNAAIEGLTSSTAISQAVKQQLLGEAKFLRAFFYFYLVNFYGDVPLVLTTDNKVNATLGRTSNNEVYSQIINDLKEAKELLSANYVKGDAVTQYPATAIERVRPNSSAATALLARVYLYMGEWNNAEEAASSVINNSTFYNLVALNSVFLKNSREAIWQLQPVAGSLFSNSSEAPFFILSFSGTGITAGLNSSHPVYLSKNLLNKFESSDLRGKNGNWINVYTDPSGTYYYPFKNKATSTSTVTPTEYKTIFRLGEQYLIRAEARAQQDNIGGARADLDSIRTRAGLSITTANTKPTLLAAILNERQLELFTEMGQRWFDLKRTGIVNNVMDTTTQFKGGSWNSYQQLYPLPVSDLSKDQNLHQNPGYF